MTTTQSWARCVLNGGLTREVHRSKYRVLGLVGQGQFGRVYCAFHRKTGRLVALKELNRDRFSTQKFLRELRFLLSLQHENIVTCYAIEQTPTGRYLVMDYCESGTLRNLLEDEVRIHPLQGLRLITQILAGLEHAHQRQIVHCDIKPENILLTANSRGWTARISDFGIARLSQEMNNDEFSNTGSPAYMAPERFYGQHSIASDLYAVGVLLFEMLTGYRPFSGPPAELMSAHLNQAVKIPESVPEALQATIRKALQKLPARRFRSAQEMLQSLQAAIAQSRDDLMRGWADSTPLRFTKSMAPVAFHPNYQELLDTPIQQLVSRYTAGTLASTGFAEPGDHFFRLYGNRVGCQPYASERVADPFAIAPLADCPLRHPPLTMTKVRLPQAIAQLVVQPQGCFAVTAQAVYWLTETLFQPPVDIPLEPTMTYVVDASAASPQLIAEFARRVMVAIAPNGRWMATTPAMPEHPDGCVQVWNLRQPHHFKSSCSVATGTGFQMVALDIRHFAQFVHLTDSDQTCITGVRINLFSRRGMTLGHFKLPLPLRQVIPAPTPYRLLATEPNFSKSLVLLDLKPLRIQRIGLDIVPELIACAVWGYAVMDRAGQIVLLDQYGQLIGRIAGPAHPTAIAFVSAHQLLIATWDQTQGHLYGVNLQELDLDILF